MSDAKDFISPDDQVDLTNCDREPIHMLGKIQSFGTLIAVTPDWIISHASINIVDITGIAAEDLIGMPISQVMSGEAVHEIRTRLQLLSGKDAVERIFGLDVLGKGQAYDVAVHLSKRTFIIEIEKSRSDHRGDYMSLVRPMIDRIARMETVEEACDLAARQLKALTGIDRVMVYRFDKDDSGEVIAEAVKSGMDSFKGLRYPASDIPKQARELYKRSLLRIISDVQDDGVPVIPARNPEGELLDLSLSVTRAVSPIHLEYLRNMGVEASMSVSIVKRGKLWGLFACHHERVLKLPFDIRTGAEIFAQLFSLVLDQKEADMEREHHAKAQGLHDRLMAQLAEGATLGESFDLIANAIPDVIGYDGMIGWIDGQYLQVGQVPSREQGLSLMRFLNTTAAGQVYATDCIKNVYPPGEDFAEKASGLLALPVSRIPRDYIVLFRQEIIKSVTWAGNPQKPAEPGPNGIRLTPRKSFEAWKEVVRHHSMPWKDTEVAAAESLRVTLMEVVLRMTDTVLRERSKAHERQEILIAELNHRVRNILALIRGLISQSYDEGRTLDEYADVLGNRVHALSRAHDQITQQNWAPASLRELIHNEIDAFLGDDAQRISVSGPDAMLMPTAFTTLSLVIHELVTNAAKYGALSNETGRVKVEIEFDSLKSLSLSWCEAGGPPISSHPERRGFGTTLIERAVPYELKGRADVRFAATGLEVDLEIPVHHVSEISNEPFRANDRTETGAIVSSEKVQTSDKARLSGDVLLVEDNMVIALDAEDCLKSLGAEQVHTASNVSEALRILEDTTPSFALLDVNLASETSEPVAMRLQAMNVRFAFATGYGDTVATVKNFPDAKVIQKPYSEVDLEAVL